MRMQNVEMEFVTFDAQDVIATSGPIPTPTTLSISGYWNGTSNDLTVNYKGQNYTDPSSLYSVLSSDGYKPYIKYKDSTGAICGDVLGAGVNPNEAFTNDKNDIDASSQYATGNGDYTWDGISFWLHSNLQ